MYHHRLILAALLMLFTVRASAQSFSDKDLNALSDNMKQYDIIGLGEAEHFRQGYYKSKVELIKHFVQHNIIDIIALEASMSVADILNSYIHGEIELDPKGILASLNEPYSLQGIGLFDTVEILEMLEWLKQHNTSNYRKVKLVGIDCQNYSIPLSKIEKYVGDDLKMLEEIRETQKLINQSLRSILDSGVLVIKTTEWLNHFKKAKYNVRALKEQIGNKENSVFFRELEQFTNLWDDPTFPRDSMMYENLKQHVFPGSRAVVWAHNFHIENDPDFVGYKKLGVFLKENYPDKYLIIGVSESDGDKNYPAINIHSLDAKYDMMINVDKGSKCERLLAN